MPGPGGLSALGGVSAPGGVSALGGVCSLGCLVLGVSALGGVCSRDVVSQHALRQTPPCEQNDRQVQKYYLGHKFVAGNNRLGPSPLGLAALSEKSWIRH